jgi:hypothetical protein
VTRIVYLSGIDRGVDSEALFRDPPFEHLGVSLLPERILDVRLAAIFAKECDAAAAACAADLVAMAPFDSATSIRWSM